MHAWEEGVKIRGNRAWKRVKERESRRRGGRMVAVKRFQSRDGFRPGQSIELLSAGRATSPPWARREIESSIRFAARDIRPTCDQSSSVNPVNRTDPTDHIPFDSTRMGRRESWRVGGWSRSGVVGWQRSRNHLCWFQARITFRVVT